MPAVAGMDLTPVIAGATPSLTLVAMVKLLLKFRAGLKVTPASKVLTSAIAPLALHTPVPALFVDVTAPAVIYTISLHDALPIFRVAVMLALSTSLATMLIRLSAVS